MQNINESVAYIKSCYPKNIDICIVLGSGLSDIADEIINPVSISYKDIPNFPLSTAPGHEGKLIIGELEDKVVLCMKGRLHFYEGYPLSKVTYPIRVIKSLGINKLILTNAAGAINRDYAVGDLVLIKDHLNFIGSNPLIGPNLDDYGPRFIDMSNCYNFQLRELAKRVAEKQGVNLQEGVYVGYSGPSYETPAEIKAFRILGGDVVGMSTVPEAIVANHCGMQTLAISCLTNMAAGVTSNKLNEDEVLKIGAEIAPKFSKLIKGIINKM